MPQLAFCLWAALVRSIYTSPRIILFRYHLRMLWSRIGFKVDFTKVYYDQQWRQNKYFENNFHTAWYSPDGIHQIDQEYSRYIMTEKSIRRLKSFRELIVDNEHLHTLIKGNLLYNLNNRLKRLHDRPETN